MKSSNLGKNVPWYISIILFSISILSSFAILITIFYMVRYLAPVDANAKPVELKIVRGMSSQAIADQLAHNSVCLLLVRFYGHGLFCLFLISVIQVTDYR